MRKRLCEALVERAADPSLVFLTGDVGFNLLEPLRDALGDRFFNMGVAEQNMIGVASGLSSRGFEVWVYSIAPFVYARPFEQVRNDLAFPSRPVTLVGNGGGYAYGMNGPSHHAIEDYGVLLALSGMTAIVPVFDSDLPAVVERAGSATGPVYLRLGLDERPEGYEPPPYAPWRKLTDGGGPVVVVVGPLAGGYLSHFSALRIEDRPELWVFSELPLDQNPPPPDLLEQVDSKGSVVVVEEHVRRGGFGTEFLSFLFGKGVQIRQFRHLYARQHVYDGYGSQTYLRRCSGLDPASVTAIVTDRQGSA